MKVERRPPGLSDDEWRGFVRNRNGNGATVEDLKKAIGRRAGARRQAMTVRSRISAQAAAYEGATKDRTYQDWVAGNESADEALLSDLPTLRQRSREAYRNNPLATALINADVRNVVGNGIFLKSQVPFELLNITREQAHAYEVSADQVFRQWMPFASADMRTDFFGLQKLIQHKKREDGEIFVRPVMINESGRFLETAMEVIEADRIEAPPKRREANTRSGIVLGRRGQPIAYWIRRTHPGDRTVGDMGATEKIEYRRIPRWNRVTNTQNVLHVYRQLRPGQTRGIPMLHAVLTDLRHVQKYLEAEEVAKRMEACFSHWIVRQELGLAWGDDDEDVDFDNDGRREITVRPGMVEELGPGEDIKFGDPKRPGETFEPYLRMMLRMIGAATGQPIEVFFLDSSVGNFSNTRTTMLEARRGWRSEQADIVNTVSAPIRELVLQEAFLKGMLDVPKGKRSSFLEECSMWCSFDPMPDAHVWIDPKKDGDLVKLQLDAGLTSVPIEAAKLGRNAEDVARSQVEYEKTVLEMREEAGLATAPEPGADGAGEGDQPAEPNDEGGPDEPAD